MANTDGLESEVVSGAGLSMDYSQDFS
jgi:hypothetical protein